MIGRPPLQPKPLNPNEIRDTIRGVEDVQAVVRINLSVALRDPSNASALQRLKDARREEDALFKTILHLDDEPWLAEGISRRKWHERRKREPEQVSIPRWIDK